MCGRRHPMLPALGRNVLRWRLNGNNLVFRDAGEGSNPKGHPMGTTRGGRQLIRPRIISETTCTRDGLPTDRARRAAPGIRPRCGIVVTHLDIDGAEANLLRLLMLR